MDNLAMGRLFGILIWTSLFLPTKEQGLFDDMGDRQKPADLALHFIRGELHHLSQGIEQMVTKKLEDVKNSFETKIGNMIETKNNESLSISQTEQRIFKQEMVSLTTNLSRKVEKIGDLITTTQIEQQNINQKIESLANNLSGKMDENMSVLLSAIQTEQRLLSRSIESLSTNLSGKVEEKISDLIITTQTEELRLRQEMASITTKVDSLLNNSENVLIDIRNISLYTAKQISSEVIDVLKYLEMISRLNNIAGSDCADILKNYPDTRGRDGVYNIMDSSNKAKAVYCDMTTDNGGWTVIQRRVNGSVDFYRNWTEYKNGFGFADHEYWIGNDLLHSLTSLKPQELRVDMERFNGEKAYAFYSNFSVGEEARKYRLQVNGYSGNAGDSLSYSHDMMFSTLDHDNDHSSGNCAIAMRSAWWFDYCAYANPNGQYAESEIAGLDKYISWYHWKSSWISLKTIQLMIRSRA